MSGKGISKITNILGILKAGKVIEMLFPPLIFNYLKFYFTLIT